MKLGFFTTDSSAVYSVLLELVHLKRNGFETHAVGWSEQALGIAPRGRAGDATREATAPGGPLPEPGPGGQPAVGGGR